MQEKQYWEIYVIRYIAWNSAKKMNELKQKEGLICSDAFMQEKICKCFCLFCFQKLKPEVELQLMLTSGDRDLTDVACSNPSVQIVESGAE